LPNFAIVEFLKMTKKLCYKAKNKDEATIKTPAPTPRIVGKSNPESGNSSTPLNAPVGVAVAVGVVAPPPPCAPPVGVGVDVGCCPPVMLRVAVLLGTSNTSSPSDFCVITLSAGSNATVVGFEAGTELTFKVIVDKRVFPDEINPLTFTFTQDISIVTFPPRNVSASTGQDHSADAVSVGFNFILSTEISGLLPE
jgi:hypothetical protein